MGTNFVYNFAVYFLWYVNFGVHRDVGKYADGAHGGGEVTDAW